MKKILFAFVFPLLLFTSCKSDDNGPTALPQAVEIVLVSANAENSSIILKGTTLNADLTGMWTLDSNTEGSFEDATTATTTLKAALFETHAVRWSISNGSEMIFKKMNVKIADNFSVKQLIEAGVAVDVILNEFSIQEIIGSGLSIQELFQAGITLEKLIDNDATTSELLDAGVTINELIDNGISLQELLNAQATVQELLAAGVTIEKLITEEVSISDLINGGVTIAQLYENGIRIQELRLAGITVEELLEAGISVQNLYDADVTISELLSGGASINQLLDIGITFQELLGASVTVEELIAAGVMLQDLVDAGVALNEILDTGVSVLELINLGVKARQLIAANILIQMPETSIYVLSYFREKYSRNDAFNFLDNFVVGEANEWRLPSIGEMRLIFDNRSEVLAEFTDEAYWSSTFEVEDFDGPSIDQNYLTKNMTSGFESSDDVTQVKRILPIIELENFE